MARESGKDAAIAFLWRQGTRHPGIRWKVGEGLALGHDFFPTAPPAALDAFRRASGPGGVKPKFSTLMTWAQTAARHGKPQDLEALDLWIRDSAFPVTRWRDPDEPGFSEKLNPPVEAVERLAAASLTRGRISPESPTSEELARSHRLYLLAVGLGSSTALRRLESAPFPTVPGAPGALARTLLETSTLNASVAVGFLRQAAAGGDAEAKQELRKWIHPTTGKPTPRLERILQRRQELQDPIDRVYVDPVRHAAGAERLDHGWLTWEQALLVRAAKKGDSQARSILVESGLMLPGLIDVTPDEWVLRVRGGLLADDPTALWKAVSEAPALWKLARRYWVEGQEPWRKAARTIAEVAVRLNRPEIAPGRSREELIPLLDIGLLAGHGPSFVNLVQVEWDGIVTLDLEERTRKRDGVVLDLTARLLNRDPGKAVFLEKTARPLVKDGARWNELLRAWTLHADDTGTPTPLLLFARENAEREIRRGVTLQGEGVDSAFLPIERRHLYGHTGQFLLKRAGDEKDPLAAQVLATLGFTANDGPKLLKR